MIGEQSRGVARRVQQVNREPIPRRLTPWEGAGRLSAKRTGGSTALSESRLAITNSAAFSAYPLFRRPATRNNGTNLNARDSR